MKKILLLGSALMLSACASQPPQLEANADSLAEAEIVAGKVYTHQLANGMKILVKVDRRAPVVVNQIWYKVGSSYEHNGITGISHMLEHMMFKETENLKIGEFSEIVAENGGRDNAFTGRDYTAYFQTIAADRLPLMMELEADRMRHVRISAAEFAKELEVVKEERRWRTEDKPTALLLERFNATAFMNSPYHHPVVGWMEDLDAMRMEDAMAWYQRWYAPNNAVQVVVGDVNPQTVFALAEKTFGKHRAVALQAPKPQPETRQRGERYIKVHGRAELPYLLLGWKVPTLVTAAGDAEREKEVYALEVLAGVLDGGNSARFPRELVREAQIAQNASASYSLLGRWESLFTLGGTPARGASVGALQAALLAQIERIKTTPVTAQELQRVKSQVLAADVYEKDSMFYQGMVLGMLETVGLSWRKADEYLSKVQAVTAEEVQAVANKYLTPRSLSVAELVPDVAAPATGVQP
ncbi:MAG: peptidase M16 [Gammaproteobacteria bacterium]|nr:MAG: peptidase M16 [Gammaproteobacteria bacterium]